MKKVLVFLLLVELARCTLFITNLTMEFDEKLGNATVVLKDDPTLGTLIGATFTTFVVIEKMILYLRINMQQDHNDKNYRKEFVKGVADVGKLLKGINSNPILKSVSGDFKKFIDFDPEFPLAKGTRKITDLEVNDRFYPFLVTTKILVSLRLVGKLAGSKKNVFLCNVNLFVVIKR